MNKIFDTIEFTMLDKVICLQRGTQLSSAPLQKESEKLEYGYSLVSEHRRTLDFYRTETETENLETWDINQHSKRKFLLRIEGEGV